jgi:HK97 family phage portal protein
VAGFWRRVVLGPSWDQPTDQQIETRASYSIGDPALAEFLGMQGTTLAGVQVNEQTALGLTAVYRAVALIAGTIAGLPLRAVRTKDDGTRERVTGTWLDNPAGPGSDTTQYEWVELVMTHLLLHGNAFLQHLYSGGGAIVGLNPLLPSAVAVRPIQTEEERANYGGPDGAYHKWFEISLADGRTATLTCADLTHVPALSTDGLRGLSPVEAHRQALGTGIAADRAAARLFGSGLLLGGMVSGDDGLSREDAEEALAQLKAKMAGADHAGDVAFINAQLKFTPWTIPPADAQFHEQRDYQIEEVCRVFGIPPHKLGLTEKQTSWGTGVAEQNRGFARDTLMAWTSRLEQRLSPLLSRPVIAEFDYKGLLQGAPEVEIPLQISQLEAGILTLDEIRRMNNLPPPPSGSTPPDDSSGVREPEAAEVP